MCLPLQDGQTPRPLHENAMTNPWPQPVQRARPSRNVTINVGSGDDDVWIDTMQVQRNLFVRLGAGDDSLKITNGK
jgi:hypothetical protein